jgi:hypothetical protein
MRSMQNGLIVTARKTKQSDEGMFLSSKDWRNGRLE